MQAADDGWGHGEPNLLGVNALDLSRVSGDQRKVQAWLYASLNASALAQRLQTLVVLKVVLSDWYFPWALLRQEDKLTDMLTELVKVRPAARRPESDCLLLHSCVAVRRR